MSGFTSFVQNQPYQAPNSLQTIGQYAQIGNALQQNQNMKAQNALIQQETQNAQLANQQGTTNLQTQRANRGAQIAYGLSNLPDAQLAGGAPVRQALDQELASGTIDQETHDQYLAGLPPATQADGSPTPASAFRQVINSHMVGAIGGPAAVDLVTGTGNINTGMGVQGVSVGGRLSANPGALTKQGAPIPLTTNPETNAQLQTVWQPPSAANGNKWTQVLVPRSTLPGASGQTQPAAIPGDGSYKAPGSLPLPPPPAPGAPQAGATPNTSQTGGTQSVAAGAPQSGTVYAAPPIGTGESIASNQSQYQKDSADYPNAQNRIRDWDLGFNAVKGASTGYGTEGANKVMQLADTLGWLPDKAKTAVENYALAQKYLITAASNRAAVSSNEGLETALKSNPSTQMPQGAALDVIATNIGRERFAMAQHDYVKAQDPTGTNNNNLANNFAKDYDRRAFQLDYDMQVDQPGTQKKLAAMKANSNLADPNSEYNKFNNSYIYAKAHGYIGASPNEQQQNQTTNAPPQQGNGFFRAFPGNGNQ